MRAVRVRTDAGVRAGVELGDTLALLPPGDTDVIPIIELEGWEGVEARLVEELPATGVSRLAPLGRPGKILCVGLNYWGHAGEQGLKPPDHPIMFSKASTAISDPGVCIPLHVVTEETDYEVELAVVIGTRARDVPVDRAYDVVAGYTILNDVTARDLQRADGQFARAKSLDGYAPIGPVLVSPSEIPDPGDLAVRCWVNDELRQNSNTRHLIFGVPEIISFCSAGLTLEPGDVLSTGTPSGVGVFMDPPRFLQQGDVVRAWVENIGELANPVG